MVSSRDHSKMFARWNLLVGSIAGAIVAGGLAGAAGAFAPTQDEVPRCDPVAVRSLDPLAVPAGETVDVHVAFDYACSEVERTIYFYLVVENSENLDPGGFGGREHFDNARAAMSAFVEEIDFANGSKGGLIVYTANESERLALQVGDGGKRSLQSALNSLTTAGRSANAAGEAVELAAEKLLAAEDEGEAVVHRAIVIVDAGATMSAPSVEPLEACQAARDAGIQVAVLSLRESEGRLAECAPEHLRRSASRPNGEDIPPEMEDLGDGMSRADQVDLVSVFDQFESGFAYETGSGTPREPDIFFINEVGWDFLPPPAEGGETLGYKIRVGEDAAGSILQASSRPLVTLNYADGSFFEVELENPDLCVHPRGNPGFCEDFIGTLTPVPLPESPTPPMETATPTDVPEETPTAETPEPGTPETPEPTPAEATPTPTTEPTDGEPRIYMPYGGTGRSTGAP